LGIGAADTFVRLDCDGEAFEFPIERLGVMGFGRSPSNAVVLPDTMASREHAMIRRNATGSCILTDLGSTNGTRLNGRLVTTPSALTSGDMIQIGRQVIAFVQHELPQMLADPNAGRTQFLLENQLVTCLVIDMRGFTPLSAALGPQRTTELMSEIFRQAGALLQTHGAWSTKFIGDAIMAVWVHPSNSISRADIVRTFDVISGYQEIFLVAQRQFQTQPLRFGCGFNAGMAAIGNIGSATAADFTAMGEAVNVTFRLETKSKELGCDVVIARQVFDALMDGHFTPEHMIDVELKGYDSDKFSVCPLAFGEIGGLVGQLLGDMTGAEPTALRQTGGA
jgi:adenylate cyclase